MVPRILYRIATGVGLRTQWCFLRNSAWNARQMIRRQRRLRKGQWSFPPFMFISVTSACNLRCTGCWVNTRGPKRELSMDQLNRFIDGCKSEGVRFFGLLGGEPLLHPDLFHVIERHRDCCFQVFTNGTILTGEMAREMRRLGNVTPLISIEGLDIVNDERRGGKGTYPKALEALEHCRREKLLFGVASSICKSNIGDLLNDTFANEMARRGAHYVWYYVYRPVGEEPAPELTLSPDEVKRLREFIVDLRTRAPLLVVDSYWDEDGRALCPAVLGLSHHIGPGGDVEPCPVIQFANESIDDDRPFPDVLRESQFMREFQRVAGETSRGCIIMERPDLLKELVMRTGAKATSGRDGLAELDGMCPHCSHYVPGHEVPEKHWFYRWAKKYSFFGFGAYG